MPSVPVDYDPFDTTTAVPAGQAVPVDYDPFGPGDLVAGKIGPGAPTAADTAVGWGMQAIGAPIVSGASQALKSLRAGNISDAITTGGGAAIGALPFMLGVGEAEPLAEPLEQAAMTLYRAGGDTARYGGTGGPTFFSTTRAGAAPYASADSPIASYSVPVSNLFDVSQGQNWQTYRQFLADTGNPAGYGGNGNPFWTAEPDLAQYLRDRGVPFDAFKFDENTGHPSIAYYGDQPATPNPSITAYHGSPYDFTQFDAGKINTGEGAQAYGHGLYFAENPNIAASYRNDLANRVYATNSADKLSAAQAHDALVDAANSAARSDPAYKAQTGEFNNAVYSALTGGSADLPPQPVSPLHPDQARMIARNVLEGVDSSGSIDQYLKDYALPGGQFGPAYQAAAAKAQQLGLRVNPGHSYEVNIGADPASFLDWDAPLSQQSPQVRQVVSSMLPGMTPISDPREYLGQFLATDYAKSFPGASDVRIAQRIADSNEPQDIAEWAAKQNSTNHAPYNLLGPLGTSADDIPGKLVLSKLQDTLESTSGRNVTDADVATALRQNGVSGIRYLDQGSRNLQIIPPDQTTHGQWLVKQIPNGTVYYRGPDEAAARAAYNPTRNYVVFDPKMIEIMRKYGVPGLVAGGAATLAGNADAATHAVPVDYDPFVAGAASTSP